MGKGSLIFVGLIAGSFAIQYGLQQLALRARRDSLLQGVLVFLYPAVLIAMLWLVEWSEKKGSMGYGMLTLLYRFFMFPALLAGFLGALYFYER